MVLTRLIKTYVFLWPGGFISSTWPTVCHVLFYLPVWSEPTHEETGINHVLTWNDYGESDLSRGINSTLRLVAKHGLMVWTIAYDLLTYCHVYFFRKLAWLGLAQCYATAFETGQYHWKRPHSISVTAPDPGPVPSPSTNFQLVCHPYVVKDIPISLKLPLPIFPGNTVYVRQYWTRWANYCLTRSNELYVPT